MHGRGEDDGQASRQAGRQVGAHASPAVHALARTHPRPCTLAHPPAARQVIALSFVKYHVPHTDWAAFWKPLWLASALLNSGYSFFWDVERDWEISWFSQMGARASLRARAGLEC